MMIINIDYDDDHGFDDDFDSDDYIGLVCYMTFDVFEMFSM